MIAQAMTIIPIYFVSNTLLAILGGLIYFQDLQYMNKVLKDTQHTNSNLTDT